MPCFVLHIKMVREAYIALFIEILVAMLTLMVWCLVPRPIKASTNPLFCVVCNPRWLWLTRLRLRLKL